MNNDIDIVDRLRISWTSMTAMGNAEREEAADEIEQLREQLRLANIDNFNTTAEVEQLRDERDEAMALIENIANEVNVLSTRPAAIIKFSDLVDQINEWGDVARKILDKKENTNER